MLACFQWARATRPHVTNMTLRFVHRGPPWKTELKSFVKKNNLKRHAGHDIYFLTTKRILSTTYPCEYVLIEICLSFGFVISLTMPKIAFKILSVWAWFSFLNCLNCYQDFSGIESKILVNRCCIFWARLCGGRFCK